MKVLLFGRNGQVGWELCRALAPLGEIIALGSAEADFSLPNALGAIVDFIAPDVIVNAAAYTAVDKAEAEPELADAINHRAVAALAEAAVRRGAWVVHYSTDYVFDGTKTSPYRETDRAEPISVYGRTKRDGEIALISSGAKHLIFRTSWVHSSRGHNFIRTMIRLAAERNSLRVVADQIGTPTSAEFISDATAHAVARIRNDEAIAPGIYNLTASGETSWHGLAQFALAEAVRSGVKLMVSPGAVAKIRSADYPTAAARPQNSRLDNAKLRAALNIEVPDWRYHATRSVAELVQLAS